MAMNFLLESKTEGVLAKGIAGRVKIGMPLQDYSEYVEKERFARIQSLAQKSGDERKSDARVLAALDSKQNDLKAALEQDKAIADAVISALRSNIDHLSDDDVAKAIRNCANFEFDLAKTLLQQIVTSECPPQNRAEAHFAQGQLARFDCELESAAEHFKAASELEPAWRYLNSYRDALIVLEDYKAAADLGQKCYTAAVQSFGKNSSGLALELQNQAFVCRKTGEIFAAEELLKEAVAIETERPGQSDLSYAYALRNLAAFEAERGMYKASESHYQEVLQIIADELTQFDQKYVDELNSLAMVMALQNRLKDAEILYRKAISLGEKSVGVNSVEYAARLNNLVVNLKAQWRFSEALEPARQALDIAREKLGTAHGNFGIYLNNYASILEDMGELEEAEPLYKQALSIFEARMPSDAPAIKDINKNIEKLLQKQQG